MTDRGEGDAGRAGNAGETTAPSAAAAGSAAGESGSSAAVQTYRGPLAPRSLGLTLMHEHVFVRDPELERNVPGLEWDAEAAVERAVAGLTALSGLGVRSVVDLTVIGLGRDVELVRAVAQRVPVNLVAATGFYATDALPLHFRLRGPGRLVDGPDPLVALMLRDIEEGIAGTPVRAALIKIASAEPGMTEDVTRIWEAAATAQRETGVAICTHSLPATRNGLEQQAFLSARGVPPERIVIGHCGDTEDLAYLRAIMDRGSTIGLDRFGMEHVLPDERRLGTLVALLEAGYADQVILSHDAAFYSHATPPSWRATHAPSWHMEHLLLDLLPVLRERGVTPEQLDRMLVDNPRRLLTPALG